MKDIGVRLREFRTRSKIKMPAIASATGIAKETLYKWEKGTKPGNIDDYYTLMEYLDKMECKLENEFFEMEARKPATLRLPLHNAGPAVPQEDGKAASGTVIFSNNQPELIVDRIYAPCLCYAEGVVEVHGYSMEPIYSNGCRIAISRIRDWGITNWGDCYLLIDKNLQLVVRRVYAGKSDNNIILVADNPDQATFPPFEREWDQILAIFSITACIIKQ